MPPVEGQTARELRQVDRCCSQGWLAVSQLHAGAALGGTVLGQVYSIAWKGSQAHTEHHGNGALTFLHLESIILDNGYRHKDS